MTDIDRSMRLNREQADRERRELAAAVEAKYGAMPPAPIRQPNETDEMFLARLKEWRNSPRVRAPAEPETANETEQNTMSGSEP
jgi:hypothetical protein